MKLIDIAQKLDTLFELPGIDEYNGIQVAHEGIITKAATAVTADLQTIEKAIALDVQLLMVHHGIFRKNDSYVLSGIKYQRVKRLMQHNIALLCYHLPLDYHRTLGNNWKAANDLGWHNLQPFGELNKIFFGVRGEFEPVSFEDFKIKLEKYYQHPATVVPAKKEIRSAALISGAAYREIRQAAQAGVDAFVTGNFDESAWSMTHEEGIAFFALGHSATEKVGPRALADYIQSTYALSCEFIDTDNPF